MSLLNVSSYSFNPYFEIKFLSENAVKENIFDDLFLAKDFVKSASSNNFKILSITCYFQATTGSNEAGMIRVPNKKFAECAFVENEFIEISQNFTELLWGKAKQEIDECMESRGDS